MSGVKRVLMVTSETVPFAKSGGLADVVTALSGALFDAGIDVRILMPYYGFIDGPSIEPLDIELSVPLGISKERGLLHRSSLPRREVPVYLLENANFYDREGIYGGKDNVAYGDNARRFVFLNRAVFEACTALEWIPEVIHLHDWPVGLVATYLRTTKSSGEFADTASVMTIHNIGYQGVFPKQDIFYTSLSWEGIRDTTNPADETMNLLRLGLRDADELTTVSPSYAVEVQSPEYGAGLDRLLVSRRSDLVGILNGIDYDEWDPTNDPLLPQPFSVDDLSGKAENKRRLQEACGFPAESDTPVIGIVSRLVDQKGFVELADPGSGSIRRICSDMRVQMVVLGTGEPWCEKELLKLDSELDNFHAVVGFDNTMAHLIEAGSDFFLMPSRYEPCGLNQMYSLRYGTLPIVRRTGGLADTVEQYDQETGAGTGFLFDDLTPQSVYDVTGWAIWAYFNRPEHIEGMRRRAMSARFSWDRSAGDYLSVYNLAIEKRRARRAEQG